PNEEESEIESEQPPYVYVVYYPENEQHVQSVVKLVNELRSCAIDARADVLDTQIASNRQFYVFSNLQKADYVLVVCSPAVKSAERMKTLNVN
ncbi:SEFIR domain-containing protein, partial [Acinetobacter baumannii]|uniref:SEFIR domain-containing protein n=1 Tax=Acinetobacter baumannii TaxID=470 RepID=UPI0011789BD0